MVTALLIIATILFAVSRAKWKITSLTISTFCIKYFREPTHEEIQECNKYVIKHIIADLIGQQLPD